MDRSARVSVQKPGAMTPGMRSDARREMFAALVAIVDLLAFCALASVGCGAGRVWP